MRVLVIAPHPDDEILGCGGTIARHVAYGDEVFIIIVSIGDPAQFSREFIEQGRLELATAHALLGVSAVRFLDFPAPKLDTVPHHLLADALRKVLLELHPDVVYLPHQGDIHLDHKAVFWATLVACRPTLDYTVKRLLCYETLSETEWGAPLSSDAFLPTVFIDISPWLEKKCAAMACYRSQIKPLPHSRSLEIITALAQLRGATICVPAAESFVLIREAIPTDS